MNNPIVIAGSGPAGMATALALRVAGHDVHIYERAQDSTPQGGGINLWAPAVKALQSMGVDTTDLASPCPVTFRNSEDRLRVDVRFDPAQIAEFGGYIWGVLRPDLYKLMRDTLPADQVTAGKAVESFADRGDHVEVTLGDGTTVQTPLLVGADGIHSRIRRQLVPGTEVRAHRLVVFMGYTFDIPDGLDPAQFVIRHSATVQGSWAGIRGGGRQGIGWYFVQAWDPDAAVPDGVALKEHCLALAREFPDDLRRIIEASTPEMTVWPVRDLGTPPQRWSEGRVVLAGDAAHATSPYAAYGAGMSIVDGYFLGQSLAGVDLADLGAVRAAVSKYETHRVEHTTFQVKQAYALGKLFHHAPPGARQLRDLILDHTPLLQKQVGERSPGQIADQLAEMGRGILQPA
ncbi:FAD-dependent oxidoreductase [Streptomyces mangrovisoli]|uniref:FAD-binding domain-containing protein n=1 Tax=Streptomyces mangrovisoli TaxID=1428628 RepID=A0A1J4P2I0_9ACTN|nr:NAD(P)/FAD-dependent oxidoreductase [Streptomyces mangrovisoli]OIJ68410.1 hypothetical protein WN71_008300 [Streptomyces mangrovisoli]